MKHIGYIHVQNIPALNKGEAVDVRPKDEVDDLPDESLKYYRAVYIDPTETVAR